MKKRNSKFAFKHLKTCTKVCADARFQITIHNVDRDSKRASSGKGHFLPFFFDRINVKFSGISLRRQIQRTS